MDGREFFDHISQHQDLTWLGVSQTENEVFIQHDGPSRSKFAVPVYEILDAEWEELEAILTCKREPEAIRHMSRIVGYYSTTRNWNKSKLAELRDRRKGSYSLSEDSSRIPAAYKWPDSVQEKVLMAAAEQAACSVLPAISAEGLHK